MHGNRPVKKSKGSLDSEKIESLLAKKKIRGNFAEDLWMVAKFLIDWQAVHGKAFTEPAHAIARELNMPEGRVKGALSEFKSERWKKATGCTVPWQPRGRGQKAYAIVDSENEKSHVLLRKGDRLKGRYNLVDSTRLLSHLEMELDFETDPVKKQWKGFLVYLQRQIVEIYNQIGLTELERELEMET